MNNHITVEFKASAPEKQLIPTDRYDLSRILEANGKKEKTRMLAILLVFYLTQIKIHLGH